MTTLTDGIYRIQDNKGEFAETMAIQAKGGRIRPVRISNMGRWGKAAEEFMAPTAEQAEKLASYGLHANQSVADHSK